MKVIKPTYKKTYTDKVPERYRLDVPTKKKNLIKMSKFDKIVWWIRQRIPWYFLYSLLFIVCFILGINKAAIFIDKNISKPLSSNYAAIFGWLDEAYNMNYDKLLDETEVSTETNITQNVDTEYQLYLKLKEKYEQ